MTNRTIKIFVAGDTEEMLADVPRGDEFQAVDLRSLAVEPGFESNALAESRFLVSEDARRVPSEYVGFCSANYDRKFPLRPHLAELPRVARNLRRGDGLGPSLSTDWLADCDISHPGLTALVEGLASDFGLTVLPLPAPYANTFVCHRDEWFRLLDAFHRMLTAALDRYGTHPPFRYRCIRCGTISDTGYGRHTSERHMGFLAERLTMLHFSSRPEVHFVSPMVVMQRKSPVLQARAQIHMAMTARGIPVRRGAAPSITPFDGPPCPGCAPHN